MAHEPPATLQKMFGVLEARTQEEADIHVILERVDVAEGQIRDAGRGMAIVPQFQDIGP